MNAVYHWVGFTVVWAALAASAWLCSGWTLSWIYNKLPYWPWLVWLIFYCQRVLGFHNRAVGSLRTPFYYNEGEMRAATKKYRPLVRQMQANIARYNRRRWAALLSR